MSVQNDFAFLNLAKRALPFYVVLFYYVFCFLSFFAVFLKELVKSCDQIGFAFAAKHFTYSAFSFPFYELRVFFFEQVNVILENGTNHWVGSYFSLLRRCGFAACEGVPDFAFHNFWRIHCEDGGFRFGGAHFSAWS